MSGEARDRPVNPKFVKLAFPTQVCELMFFLFIYSFIVFDDESPECARVAFHRL